MVRNSRGDGRRPLKRTVATRTPRKTLLVFCEGQRTEPEYLEALKRQPSVRDVAAVDLRIETSQAGRVPVTLVSIAADARKKALDEEAEIDEFWCVFDVEWPQNHPGLKDAIERAHANNIELAISNPCFELWLILHFQDQRRWLDNDAARKLRGKIDGSNNKGLDAKKYMPGADVAAGRAVELDKLHLGNGTLFPDNNPSSGMHRLLAAVRPPKS